ncbi:MAG: response regulator [Deltaproteobacteria bacterium]|nr:response regulator [Deltaproteobacteria bacterium]
MKTILIADDEPSLRMLTRITLDDPDYRILEAADGSTALDLVRNEKPDLLILDWMMPGLTGIEVAHILRQDPRTATIPIIMLTAKGQDTDKAQGRAAGVNAYLVKPFSPLELLQQIQAIWHPRTPRASNELPEGDLPFDLPEVTAEVQQQLNTPSSQLALYARDLKRIVDAERQKAKELAEANARLHILDQLKTDFLSFISHELRTPLNAFSAVDIFEPHSDPKEQAEVLGIIRRGYERLHEFVERGIEYFTWSALNPADPTGTTDLTQVVKHTLTAMPELTGVTVRLHLPPADAPCLAHGTHQQIGRVVKMVLENAVKFSAEEKAIQITLAQSPQHATLTITDRGEGFPPELAREIFRPFTTTNLLHHSRGTGLSLALASAIVETYGGTIRAESLGPGQGASFIIELPTALSPSPSVV